jgi:predicted ribosome quality control (RQC) complex YloA/Tae2 family protein
MKVLEENGVMYRLGCNAFENNRLLEDADPGDWWFHVDGHPSGHCIVDSLALDEHMIKFAAKVVKDHSSQKNKKRCRVVYCRVNNVQRTKIPGKVVLSNTTIPHVYV